MPNKTIYVAERDVDLFQREPAASVAEVVAHGVNMVLHGL